MDQLPSTPRRIFATLLLALVWAVALAAPAVAQSSEQQLTPRLHSMQLMDALKQGGYTILVRHMATVPATHDPSTFDIDDCSTQRNLSDTGRRQAELIGQSFQKLGIGVGEVLSSPYCRCMDTGQLAFGKAATSEVLRVGDSRPGTGRDDPGIAIRKLLDTPPEAGKNTVLIAHSVTLLYAFGLTSRPEGVAHVFRPTGLGLGRPDYIGIVKPGEWPVFAGIDVSGESADGEAGAGIPTKSQ